MALIYTSNSPEFLNYIASCKTRNDIINDPSLCVLLEDPHIKDNMELALLFREAQYGNYTAKREFLQYFLANGPELDTDTIMFFREKTLHDPALLEIYLKEFTVTTQIYDIRVEVYSKPVVVTSDDSVNCLQNPCDYLGPFSSSIGLMGDSRNFNTLSNVFARISSSNQTETSKDKSKDDKKTKDKEKSKKEDEKPDTTTWGNIREHVANKLIPDVSKSYQVLMANLSNAFGDFAQRLKANNLNKEVQTFGDSKAEEHANDIDAAVKVNIVSNLGDCSRIWEQMRRLRVYDPSSNSKGPIASVSGNKNVDGTPKNTYNTSTDNELKSKPLEGKKVGGPGKTLIKSNKPEDIEAIKAAKENANKPANNVAESKSEKKAENTGQEQNKTGDTKDNSDKKPDEKDNKNK